MHIHDDHLYHGAALIQIAEHKQFTAINSFELKTGTSRSAYRINDKIGVYLKYSSKPATSYKEYTFTFRTEHLQELEEIAKKCKAVFVALVCVRDKEICCLPYKKLLELISVRKKVKKEDEDQYMLYATLPKNSKFRIYLSYPGKKKTILGSETLIARNSFPDGIFGS